MNSPESDARDAMLTRVLSGELGLDDAQVQAAIARDPELARELDEMRRLADELDGLGVPDVAAEAEPWSGADRQMADLLRSTLSGRTPGRPETSWGGPRRWPLLALLAAAGLAVGVWLWNRPAPAPVAPPDLVLGFGELWPTGATSRQALRQRGFCWGVDDVQTSAFEVTVFDGAGRQLGEPTVVKRASRWQPADLIDDLPDVFQWRVVADLRGRSKQTWFAEVQLLP